MIAAAATFSGSVAAAAGFAGLVGPMDGPEHFSGSVSRAVVDSLDLALMYRFSVVLGGEALPPEDLVGPLEVERAGIDSWITTWSFRLAGRRWGAVATTRTWTLTPVEIWVTTGPAGALTTRLYLSGYVRSCDQEEGQEPIVRVQCSDPSALYDRIAVCFEVPPGSGLTRGEIAGQVLDAVGVLSYDLPPGALYQRGVQTDSKPLFEFLRAFGEPENWSWRWRNDGTLEAYTVGLRRPPEPADWLWTLAEVQSVEVAPPTDVASRYAVRGALAVSIDEAGIETSVRRVITEGVYAPKWAVSRQEQDGSLTPLAGSEPETLRVISVLEDETRQQGGRVISQVTREFGWFNPAAAKLRTPDAAEGPGPVEDGYHYTTAFIDAEGKYNFWQREVFLQTGERRETPSYDVDGSVMGKRVETWSWYRKSMAVRNVGSGTLNVVGAAVGGDDASWFAFEVAANHRMRVEDFGLSQLDLVTSSYGPTGAAESETIETWQWFSQRVAVAGNPWFLTYSGHGQRHLLAPLQVTRREITRNILSDDGLLLGSIATTLGFSAPRRIGGPNDFGDFSSNANEERFQLLGRTTTQINVLSESQYEEVTVEPDGTRSSRLISGRAPLPRYRSSTWTLQVQQPVEVVLDDPAALAWFGPRTDVISCDYLATLDEAHQLAARRQERAASFRHTVRRPLTAALPGDTVHLVDPRQGIDARCLVVAAKETWTLAPNTSVIGEYQLEQPL